MKRKITITFELDPNEYDGATDTPESAVYLALAILNNETDMPDEEPVKIECDDVVLTILLD